MDSCAPSEAAHLSARPLLIGQPPASPSTTHSEPRITYLDGWRGLSILLVLFGHFVPHTEPIAKAGVQMFFALSGRLMAEILFVERYSLRKFYLRRFSRVYPGLVVFIALSYLLVAQTSLSYKPLAAVLGLTFLLNLGMVFGHGVAVIENLWSLCIEEHSYLLLGIVAYVMRRSEHSNAIRWLAFIALASLLDGVFCAFVLHQSEHMVTWRTDTQLAPIFLAAAAYLYLRDRQMAGWVSIAAVFLAIGAQILGPFVGYSVGTMLLSVAIACVDDAPMRALNALAWKPLAQMGLWSYSIYLWQQPFYRFWFEGALSWPLAVAFVFAAGLLSFYFVEQPARRWLNKRTNRWPLPAPAIEVAGA